MGIQESQAADNGIPSFPSSHGYFMQSNRSTDVGSSNNRLASTWHRPPRCVEFIDETERALSFGESHGMPATNQHSQLDQAYTSEYLTELLCATIVEQEREIKAKQLAEAFLEAPDWPPITKQSLGELNIENIVTNINLRHDINFDCDLSFRPNLDGDRGREKKILANKYWTALIAEIRLHDHFFHHQSLPQSLLSNRKDMVHYTQRRLPNMFCTIRDILKSLTPEQDHPQVDQILDISILMQSIEHGVFDLLRLGEWIANLLKEHCAPMRDVMVDAMVDFIREGARKQNVDRSELIVYGLRELLGILEAMKLDVANHQIRNLKGVLIEDGVHFERQYHLDGLVNFESRINVKAAGNWYADELDSQHTLRHWDSPTPNFELGIFTRAVVAILIGKNAGGFPETFHLDYDRLYRLKAEIDNLVFLEICTDTFLLLTEQFGSSGSASLAIAPLQNSITAIMSEAKSCSLQDWIANSEALSLEILRQASHVTGQSPTDYISYLTNVSRQLQHFFSHRSTHYSSRIERSLLPRILRNVKLYAMSPAMDLFIHLVAMPSHIPELQFNSPQILTLNSVAEPSSRIEPAKLMSLTNRITHIILLHWRTWRSVAYIKDQNLPQFSPHPTEDGEVGSSLPPQPKHSGLQSLRSSEAIPQLLTAMKTGELSDASQEAHVAHQTHSQ